MQEKLIMQELAKKLNSNEGGSCEYDSSCAFGLGVKECSADRATIINKLKQQKAEYESNCSLEVDPDTRPWPCSVGLEIVFTEPDAD